VIGCLVALGLVAEMGKPKLAPALVVQGVRDRLVDLAAQGSLRAIGG